MSGQLPYPLNKAHSLKQNIDALLSLWFAAILLNEVPMSVPTEEVGLYIEHAREMLNAAAYNISGGFYGSAVNRAYYAIFYAANALLATQGLSRSRHSGVIAAFRQSFVKPGLIEAQYGDTYGRIMDDRHASDYDVEASIDPDRAQTDLDDAIRFVDRSERYLNERGFL